MNEKDTLAELRVWRDEFARSHGYDLAAMATTIREMDRTAGARIVRGGTAAACTRDSENSNSDNQTIKSIIMNCSIPCADSSSSLT
jgi:hypothetical protein